MRKAIAILGGTGFTGTKIAHHLLEQTTAQILIISRNLERSRLVAAQLNGTFPGNRVTACQADASNPIELRKALDSASLLLVAAPLTSAPCETVVRTAMDAGVDYMDVQIGNKKLEFLKSQADEITRRGLCFVTEAGFHPGLPAAMVRFAASKLDKIDSAVVAGYLNMGGQKLAFTDSVDELVEMFQEYQSQVFKDGHWSRSNSIDLRKVDFGGDIGRRRCFSMFFPELRALPELYPTLEQLGFYLSETHWFLDYGITFLVMAGLKLFPRRGKRILGRLFWWGMLNLPRPPHRVELMVNATGSRNGQKQHMQLNVSHIDGYELTAVPVVAAVMQILEGSARRPGLWMMGHLVDPARLFQDCEKMGITVRAD